MDRLGHYLTLFVRYALGWAAAALLCLLTLVTCADVVGRYFFDSPLIGAYEVTEVGLALLIYAALPAVALHREHVSVTLLQPYVPASLRALQRVLLGVVSTALLGLVAWTLWQKASSLDVTGTRTDMLHVPLGLVAYFMSLVTGLSAVVTLLDVRRAGPGRAED